MFTPTPVHNVHSNIIHSSQKLETIHMFINWWMDKQMWYISIQWSIIQSQKWMEFQWRPAAIWMNLVKEARYQRPHIIWFHDSKLHHKVSGIGRLIEIESRLEVVRGLGEEKTGNYWWVWGLFWVWWNILELDGGNNCTTLSIYEKTTK